MLFPKPTTNSRPAGSQSSDRSVLWRKRQTQGDPMKKPMTREQFMCLSPETQYQLYSDALDICLEYQRLTNELIDLATPPSKDHAPDTKQHRIDLLGILPRP